MKGWDENFVSYLLALRVVSRSTVLSLMDNITTLEPPAIW